MYVYISATLHVIGTVFLVSHIYIIVHALSKGGGLTCYTDVMCIYNMHVYIDSLYDYNSIHGICL